MNKLEDVELMIIEECEALRDLLIEKNKKYGNSVIEPRRIFSQADPIEQIKVRLDDKLSRIQNQGISQLQDDEDAEKDILGYLILLRIAKRIYTKGD